MTDELVEYIPNGEGMEIPILKCATDLPLPVCPVTFTRKGNTITIHYPPLKGLKMISSEAWIEDNP